LPVNEAFAFYYNPAQLSVFADNSNFELQFYPQKVDWLPDFMDCNLNNFAVNIGYNFKNITIPLKVGIGYLQNEFKGEYGGIYEGFDENYTAVGFALGLNYYVDVNFGLTYKKINSRRTYFNWDVKTNAFDYGLLITLPVFGLMNKKFEYNYSETNILNPFLNFSLGYAKKNIGDKVKDPDSDSKYPIPTSANFGYAVSGGINLILGETIFKAFTIDYSIDAGDELVLGNGDYQKGFLGDINIFDNILLAKSEENIIVHKGFRYSIFEILYITHGRFGGGHFNRHKTYGFGFSSEGVFKYLNKYYNIGFMDYLSKHADIKYFHSKIDGEDFSPLDGTTFNSISLVVKGF
ncbi:MAG: hypothetical protein KAR38_01690, partial [Calditrichia bacterium]|nr:hypothetical protein [Calditrichia bacterium]